METPIHSTKNPLVRRFRRIAKGDDPELMLAEGQRLVREALDTGQTLVEVAWSPRLITRGGEELLAGLVERAAVVHECADRVLDRLSHLDTHQGVSVIMRRPACCFDDLLGEGEPPLIVVAAGVRDPGNIGALVRSAEAAGATGMIAVSGSADPFRDKALRGSAGSAFRLPCLTGLSADAVVAELARRDVHILVAERSGGVACFDVDLRRPFALILGAEVDGVPAAFAAAARVSVPLAAPVESLNVAVAAGVLLFEARRQRR